MHKTQLQFSPVYSECMFNFRIAGGLVGVKVGQFMNTRQKDLRICVLYKGAEGPLEGKKKSVQNIGTHLQKNMVSVHRRIISSLHDLHDYTVHQYYQPLY